MADAAGAVDLSAPKHAGPPPEAPQVAPPDEEDNREVVDTAFTVVVLQNGSAVVTSYTGTDYLLERNPTPDLVQAYLALTLSDLQAQKVSETTVQTQFARAQQMQQQIAQQQQAAQIAQGLDLSKMRS